MSVKQNRFSRLLWFVVVGALSLLASCRTNRSPAYQFDPHPSSIFQTGGPLISMSPQIGLSASGTLFVLGVHGDKDHQQLALAISHNGGDSFETPIAVTDPTADIRMGGESSPSLGVTNTAIYALWEQSIPAGGSELLFAREPSPGKPFQPPVRVTDKTEPSFNGFASLAAAPNGDIYAVWLAGRSHGGMHGTFSVYMSRSTDRGLTFGPNMQVSTGACPCCRPRISFGATGQVFVFWRDVFNGQIRDMVASVSNDNGATFAPPVRVSVDNWKINGCPESGPVATPVGHRVYVAWMTEADQRRAGVRLSWTDDGGKSFAPSVSVSQEILDANHPSLSATDDSHAVLVFQGRSPQKDGHWTSSRPFIVEIDPSGALSKPAQVSSGNASSSYPVVATGTAGRIFVAWTDSGPGETQILLSRGRRTSP